MSSQLPPETLQQQPLLVSLCVTCLGYGTLFNWNIVASHIQDCRKFFDPRNRHSVHNAVSLVQLSHTCLANASTRRNGIPTSRIQRVLLAAVLLLCLLSTIYCISSLLVFWSWIVIGFNNPVSQLLWTVTLTSTSDIKATESTIRRISDVVASLGILLWVAFLTDD